MEEISQYDSAFYCLLLLSRIWVEVWTTIPVTKDNFGERLSAFRQFAMEDINIRHAFSEDYYAYEDALRCETKIFTTPRTDSERSKWVNE